MGPVQQDSVGVMQRNSGGPVPAGSEGEVPGAAEGATRFGGARAAGFGGAGAVPFPGGGASRFRRREAVRQESEQESDSNRSAPEEAGQGTTTASRLAAGGAPPYSPYVAGVILDHSRELGDDRHGPANVSQALRLWQTSGLDDAAFVALLHETRRRVRLAQGQQGSGGLLNKMAYYFRVLEDLARGAAPGS